MRRVLFLFSLHRKPEYTGEPEVVSSVSGASFGIDDDGRLAPTPHGIDPFWVPCGGGSFFCAQLIPQLDHDSREGGTLS